MRLVILGGESLGRETLEIASLRGYDDIVFLDDGLPSGQTVGGRGVRGGFIKATEMISPATEFFVAVGRSVLRKKWVDAIEHAGGRLATLVHPGAGIASTATIGVNSMVDFGCHVAPGATLGRGCILWSSVIISHDCSVGEYCFIGPGAVVAGYTHIGGQVLIGCGANLRPFGTIGNRVVIEMGANVTVPLQDDYIVGAGRAPQPLEGRDANDLFFGSMRSRPAPITP